jgi:hypothetical protein
VLLWGDADSFGPGPQMIALAHHIIQVGATFKIHALAAARAEASTDIIVEKFLATRATRKRPDGHSRFNRSGSCTTARLQDPPRDEKNAGQHLAIPGTVRRRIGAVCLQEIRHRRKLVAPRHPSAGLRP